MVHKAIGMAIGRARPSAGLIFHSDRGSVYTASATQRLLNENGILPSMSRPGTPHDNQLIESFWRTLKLEAGPFGALSFAHARRNIAQYIEQYYNEKRLHSGIGYRTPNKVWESLLNH